jgi:hypothetical protein
MDPSSSPLSSLGDEAIPSVEPEDFTSTIITHPIEEEPVSDPEDEDDLSELEENASHPSTIYSERSRSHTPSDTLVDASSNLPTTFSRGWMHFIKHDLTALIDLGSIKELVDQFPLQVHRAALPELFSQTKFLLELYDMRREWLWKNFEKPSRCMALMSFPIEEMGERFGLSENLPGFERYLEWVDTLGNRTELEQSYDENALKAKTREVLEFLDKLLKKTRELETMAKLVACAEIGTCDWLWEQNEHDPMGNLRTAAPQERADDEGNGNATTTEEVKAPVS